MKAIAVKPLNNYRLAICNVTQILLCKINLHKQVGCRKSCEKNIFYQFIRVNPQILYFHLIFRLTILPRSLPFKRKIDSRVQYIQDFSYMLNAISRHLPTNLPIYPYDDHAAFVRREYSAGLVLSLPRIHRQFIFPQGTIY